MHQRSPMAAAETGPAGHPCPQMSVHHPVKCKISNVATGDKCNHGVPSSFTCAMPKGRPRPKSIAAAEQKVALLCPALLYAKGRALRRGRKQRQTTRSFQTSLRQRHTTRQTRRQTKRQNKKQAQRRRSCKCNRHMAVCSYSFIPPRILHGAVLNPRRGNINACDARGW